MYRHGRISREEQKEDKGRQLERREMTGKGVVIGCADLRRDGIFSLLLTEPAREPRVACFAGSGWKPTGTAVKGWERAGTMKTVSGQPGDYRDKNKSEENPGLDRRVGDGPILRAAKSQMDRMGESALVKKRWLVIS